MDSGPGTFGPSRNDEVGSCNTGRTNNSVCKMKTGPNGPVEVISGPAILLDLGFAEFDVLARDRIVLLLDQLVGHGARILLGDVVEAGIRRGNELDLDGDRFGHGFRTSDVWESSGAGQTACCWRVN